MSLPLSRFPSKSLSRFPSKFRAKPLPMAVLVCLLVAAGFIPVRALGQIQQETAQASGPESLPAGIAPLTPKQWAEAAAQNELGIIQNDGTLPLRYRVRKTDSKGDTTREVIETRQGSVARLIERNGQPLTAAEDAAERQRLQDELDSPDDFAKRHKRDSLTRQDSMDLVRLLPQAMLNAFTPGQPQPPGSTSPQVVLDFHPNPTFHPPTMLAEALTGFAGRAWIDARSRRLTRIEARVLRPVNFGWGIVGRIYPGGTIEFEQVDAGDNRWVYSHVDAHLTLRVVVKTVPMNDTMTAGDFHMLPSQVSLEQGIHMLLAMPVQVR